MNISVMTRIQIVLILFVMFAIATALLRGRKKRGGALWTGFWVLVGIIVLVPGVTTRIAEFLGVGRGADLVLYAGMVLVFYILFRGFVRIEAMEGTITKLVQHIALTNVTKKE